MSVLSDRFREKRTLYLEALSMGLILVLALALRVVGLNRGFWEDECFEYTMSAARPLWGVLTFQPFPLYHLFAHFALYIADQEWALRLPSVISGVLGVAALYLLARAFTGRGPAAVAALMLATSTFHIVSSAEARFYALVMLAALLMLYTLHRALIRGHRRDWALFVLAGNMGTMSHATVLPLLFAMAAGGALWIGIDRVRQGRAKLFRRWMVLTACVALSLAGLAAGVLIGDYALSRTITLESDTPLSLDPAIEGATEGDDLFTYRLSVAEYIDFYGFYFEGLSPGVSALLIVLSLVGLVYIGRKSGAMCCILLAALLVTPVPFFLITVTHWYHPRYFCFVIPFVLFVLAGGLAGVHAVLAEAIRRLRAVPDADTGAATSVAARVGGGFVLVLFVLTITPSTLRNLRALYQDDFGRGLHVELEHKRTARFIQENAAPTDFAATFFPRPDWQFYDRKFLASHLVQPATSSEPFNFWYVYGMGNWHDPNEIPIGAHLEEEMRPSWLGDRRIRRFRVHATHLRLLPGLTRFITTEAVPEINLTAFREGPANRPFSLPTSLEIHQDRAAWKFGSDRVAAMPHRYVEFVLTASGPPQIGILLKFYDDAGNLLLTESRWMRDTGSSDVYLRSGIVGEDERVVAQREPHPAGAAPPMPPSEGPFTIKLAAVSPPRTASMNAEIQVRGDTRAGDLYALHSMSVQGDWPLDTRYTDLRFPTFPARADAGAPWAFTATGVNVSGEFVDPSDAGKPELVIRFDDDESAFSLESQSFGFMEATTLQLETEFQGNIDAVLPQVYVFDAEGQQIAQTDLRQPSGKRRDWLRPNMAVIESDNGWSKIHATLALPDQPVAIKIVFRSNLDLDRSRIGTQLRLRSPKMYGDL